MSDHFKKGKFMSEKSKEIHRRYQMRLRAEAEAVLGEKQLSETSEEAPDVLRHELSVHQIELEMQNEDLRQAYVNLEEIRDRYVDLYEFSPVAYLALNRDGMITGLNLTAETLFTVERRKVINHRFARFVADVDKKRWHHLFMDMFRGKADNIVSFDLCMLKNDGIGFDARFTCKLRGEPPMLHIALTDITQIRKADTQLRIAAIAFESQGCMLVTDNKGVIVKVNHAFTETTGYTAVEVLGKTPGLLHSGYHDTDFYVQMWADIAQKGSWRGEIQDKRKNGDIYSKWVVITAVKDDLGQVTNYVAAYSDIMERNVSADKFEHLAFHDALTNLPNRRRLQDRLLQAMETTVCRKQTAALLFIDLDYFKVLNDSHGHDMGDNLLKQVAARLGSCVRKDDLVARLGGDEFVVILENLSEDTKVAVIEASTRAREIHECLGQPYSLFSHTLSSTSSIGVTLFSGYKFTVSELLKKADIAMYQAKMSGRNTVCFYEPAMQEVVTVRALKEASLQQALNCSQLETYFYPQINQQGVIVAAEALIRWHHPELGLVLPEDFIPFAEDTGLIMPISQQLMETVFAQLKKWENQTHNTHLHLAVNISSRQFHHVDFVENMLALIKKVAINPEKLMLELTESLVMMDMNVSIRKMNALKEIGVCFSLNNFGKGYSSLFYLPRLPLEQLKIDQSFVSNIGVCSSDEIIVKTIIGIAKNLGIEVIAEGVETREQQEFLELHGCTLFQGFLFSEPMNIEAFEQMLASSL
jgi:diguanylate cyclase (GGDEF)-like protein/PAS domain S-box-containing protein